MNIIVCDVCKNKNKEAIRANLPTGKSTPDPAGGSSQLEFESIDLCLVDAVSRLEMAYTRMNLPPSSRARG